MSFKKTDTDFHGFQITAQDRYYGNRLGSTFINVGDDEDTQVEGGGRYVTHTKKGTQQKFWHVKWQAPPADFLTVNPVRFYAMGVESNNDETSMGDYVYTATRLIVVEPKRPKRDKRSTLLTRARNAKKSSAGYNLNCYVVWRNAVAVAAFLYRG